MQAAIVVILLSFCASLALPVPVDKSNQRREEREISIEELESQLEDIENRVDTVRKKVKEETKENTKNVDTTKRISPTSSTEKFFVSKTEPEGHKTVENAKTTKKYQVIVEKKTSVSPTRTPTPKIQLTNTETNQTPTSVAKTTAAVKVVVEKITPNKETKETDAIKLKETETHEEIESEVRVEKIPAKKSEQVEEETGATFTVEKISPEKKIEEKRKHLDQEQTAGGTEEKLKEEDKAKSAFGFVVEKVTEKGTEETVEQPGKIKVEKLANDETEDEEADLESGRAEKNEKPAERVNTEKPAVTTPVKTTKTEFKIEKISPSPNSKSPAKSEQSKIVVKQVQPKLTVETKRSLLQQRAEDEDLEVGGASKSSDGKGKIVVKVEKVSGKTSSAKEPPPAEGGQSNIVVKVEKIYPTTTDKTDSKVSTPVKTAKTEFKIEKITPSTKSPATSEQSEIVVEQVQPKLTIETKRSQVQQRAEDEDLKVDETSKSSDGKGKIVVKVEKVSAKEPTSAEGDQRNIVHVKVEKLSPTTDETDTKVLTPVKTAKTEFKIEKITPSTKSPATSEQSEIVVEQVQPKLTIETKRSQVQQRAEDEDLKVDETSKSSDGKGKIVVKVEKISAKEPTPAEGDQRNIVHVKVEKLSPTTDETDTEIIKPVKTVKTKFKIEKITPSTKSPATSEQSEIVVEQVRPKLTIETKRSRVQQREEDEDLKVNGASKSTVTGEVPTSKGRVDQISISVEKTSPSKRPASVTAQISVEKVVKATSEEEEEDLKHSDNKVNLDPVETLLSKGKQSDDATDDSEEEALELELEGGQKSKTDEQKIAEEFDKALEAERNARKEHSKTVQTVRPTKPSDALVTAKPQQVTTGEKKQTSEDETENELFNIAVEQNDEAASEKEELKRGMSDEELELNELVQNTMNDDNDKEETTPTEKPTTATSKVVVIKVEKVPKVSMKVTKENNELLLSKTETAKEENELKDELAHELEQEKARPLPVIVKVEKLGSNPDTKAAAENARDDSEIRPDKEENDATSEEAEQEAELEDEADAKTKRAASITRVKKGARNDPEEQLESLLNM